MWKTNIVLEETRFSKQYNWKPDLLHVITLSQKLNFNGIQSVSMSLGITIVLLSDVDFQNVPYIFFANTLSSRNKQLTNYQIDSDYSFLIGISVF